MRKRDEELRRRNSTLKRRRAAERHTSYSNSLTLANLVELMQLRHSQVSITILMMYLIIELMCVSFYIWTIEERTPSRLNDMHWRGISFWMEVGVSWMFVFEWLCILFVKQNKLEHIVSFSTFVDYLTCFPMTVLGIGALFSKAFMHFWIPMYLRVWRLGDDLTILLQFRPFSLWIGAYGEVVDFSITLFSMMITCIGTHQIVESVTGGSVSFYNASYMMVITFATIGYGDVSPTTTPARIVAVVFIIIGICYFLPFMSLLASAGQMRQLYQSFNNRSRKRTPHVIICGEFTDKAVEILLMNFYSGWRRYLSTKIVLMAPQTFSSEVRLLVDSPWFKGRVILLKGEPSKESDLQRADAHHADAIFLCGNAGSSAYYNDYQILSQSLAVAMYDSVLPQHILLRRLHLSTVENSAANVLEMERFLHNLMGMGMVLPGVVPLLMNLLRTYEALTAEIESARDWMEQYDFSLRQDLITVPVLDSLRGLQFVALAKEFYEREMTLIGVLDWSNKVVLNPQELIGNSIKLLVIARSMKMVVQATEDIAKMCTKNFGEEILHVPNMEHYLSSLTTMAKHGRNQEDLCFDSSSSSSLDSTFFSDGETTSPRLAAEYPDGGIDKTKLLIPIEDAMDFENHVVIIDLSAAKARTNESRYASEAMISGAAHDTLMLIAPVQKICPQNEIVLLTCDSAQFPYIEGGLYEKRKTLKKPLHYIFGCGLNTNDLRRCNFPKCAGCCVFYSGDISRGGSTSAMTMMVVLSIMDIVKAPEGSSPSFPIMVELEGLVNLPYFPPYGSDPRLLVRSSRDYVFEPSYLVGNTLSRQMLFPILLRTYFVDEFLDVMSTMINGHNVDEPSLGKVLLSQFEAEMVTYKDVTDHCLNLGYLPLGLHRLIDDPLNPALMGHRFVFTNPPPALPVLQDSDAIFFLTSAPPIRQV